MLSALLVIGGVLVGLFVLLALIVSLSSRGRDTHGTTSASRGSTARTPGWVVDAGRPHPDTWGPLSQTSTEIRAIR
jgi:hypothetical protein